MSIRFARTFCRITIVHRCGAQPVRSLRKDLFPHHPASHLLHEPLRPVRDRASQHLMQPSSSRGPTISRACPRTGLRKLVTSCLGLNGVRDSSKNAKLFSTLNFFFLARTLAPSERLRPWTGPPVAHFEAPGPHPNENKLAAHRLHRRTHALLSSALMGKCSKRFSSMLQVAATRMLAREESP